MAHLNPNIGWVPRGSGAPVIQVILKVKMYQGHVLYLPEQGNDSTSSGFGFGGGARGLVVYLLYHRNIALYHNNEVTFNKIKLNEFAY